MSLSGSGTSATIKSVATPKIVLASSSPYRAELLRRLGLDFAVCSPDVDETRLENESAYDLVSRLSRAKASKVADDYDDALVIGSDQVAVLGDEVLGKSGSREKAIEQLNKLSGKRVTFLTGLCLVDTRNSQTRNDQTQLDVVPFHVHFRTLSEMQIQRYLKQEQPYDCAGSFRSEGLGISLFERLEGDDPTALIGLPLIRLISMLANTGLQLP